MNVFTAVTRIGADAEQRFTQGGDSVVSFNGAVDSGFGEKKVTTWIKFTLWGKRGTSVLPYLTKGAQVAVSGELANRKWQDKDGQDRYSLEVRLNDVTLIGGKPSSDSQPREAAQSQNKPKPSFDDLESDILF
jgi:single-strand DNA-binding protein